ncbi:MAG: hypothetical protein AAF414_10480 [Pseudomonadota bacterium]
MSSLAIEIAGVRDNAPSSATTVLDDLRERRAQLPLRDGKTSVDRWRESRDLMRARLEGLSLVGDDREAWAANREQVFPVLNTLDAALPDDVVTALWEYSHDIPEQGVDWRQAADRFFETQPLGDKAPDGYPAIGPRKDAEIQPMSRSDWGQKGWVGEKEFANYKFTEHGVIYRGREFRPGDVFLTVINRPDFTVTAVCFNPWRYITHITTLVFLEHEGLKYPAVLETHEGGIRAVPLSGELHPRKTNYVEIYRHRDMTPDKVPALTKAAEEVLERNPYFSFNPDLSDESVVTCSELAHLLLKNTGLEPPKPLSRLGSGLVAIDFGSSDVERPILAPSDLAASEYLDLVECIDFLDTTRLICGDLVNQVFQRHLDNKRLKIDALPVTYKVLLGMVGEMQKGGAVGRFVGRRVGYDDLEELPKNPPSMIALFKVSERAVKKATNLLYQNAKKDRQLHQDLLYGYADPSPLLHEALDRATADFRKWYE